MTCTHAAQIREAARLARLLEDAAQPLRRGVGERFSSGCPALDRLLPGGGVGRGMLVEWLGQPGGGASCLAIAAVREAQRQGGVVVVIDRDVGFYPPAAAAWGIDLASLIVVHPASAADETWALDQSLRCEHAAAVLAWPRRLEGRIFRRLQLAAEASGAVGLLVRPAAAGSEPSWAHVRLAVTPQPTPLGATTPGDATWRLAVEVVRARGAPVMRSAAGAHAKIIVDIDPLSGEFHEARAGDLAATLAPTAPRPERA